MNTVACWYPGKDLQDVHNRLSSLLNRSTSLPGNGQEESLTVAEWAPLVDISEDEKEYVIKAELAEVQKDEVHVSVEDGVLVISGERKIEKEVKGQKYHRIERSYGKFSRSFGIPDDADATKVSAGFKDGVLSVHLPKGEKAIPKQIEIKIA